MPYKLKVHFLTKFNKAKYHLNNWPAYNEAIKSRGKLTIWFTDDLKDKWYYKSERKKRPGAQKKYSNLAILTVRTIGTIYNQCLRQTEGLVESIVNLMHLNLDVPDFSTLSRRTENLLVQDLSAKLDPNEIINIIIDSTELKIYGNSEWQDCKYNLNQRKGWRKLHIVLHREAQKIITSELTTHHVGDVTAMSELLNKINSKIASVTADGAYDIEQVYKNIADANAIAIIPPKDNCALTNYCIKNIPGKAAGDQ